MRQLAELVREREEALRAARASGLSPRSFAISWVLRDDAALRAAGVAAADLAQECEMLLARFPNAGVNADEQRKLRAALYRPLLQVSAEDRGRLVDLCVATLVNEQDDEI